MLIWGTKVTRPVVGSGEFYCPECQAYKSYRLVSTKKWGHLYFIPIIPLEDLGRHVACGTCKTAFKEDVLNHDPEKERFKLMTVLSVTACRGLAAIAGAGGRNLPPERIAQKIASVFKMELAAEDIARDVAQLDEHTLLSDAAGCAAYFNAQGKEAVLAAAVSEGLWNDEQTQLARRLGRSLGMSDAHIQGVLQCAAPKELKAS